VGDVLAPAKMASFEAVVKQLYAFLVIFQNDNSLLPFVCTQLHTIITTLMKHIVKPSLDDSHSVMQLLNIEFEHSSSCIRPAKVDVGYMAENTLKQLQQKRH